MFDYTLNVCVGELSVSVTTQTKEHGTVKYSLDSCVRKSLKYDNMSPREIYDKLVEIVQTLLQDADPENVHVTKSAFWSDSFGSDPMSYESKVVGAIANVANNVERGLNFDSFDETLGRYDFIDTRDQKTNIVPVVK